MKLWLILLFCLSAVALADPVECPINFALLGRGAGLKAPTKFSQEVERALTADQRRALMTRLIQESDRSEQNISRILAAAMRARAAKDQEEFDFVVGYLAGERKQGDFSVEELRSVWPRIKKAESHFSTEYDLASEGAPGAPRSQEALLGFQKLLRLKDRPAELAKKADDWAKSPAHALYLYQNLGALKEQSAPVLSYLIEKNQYFKRVGRIRGPPASLVTMSWEKETRNPLISLLYRRTIYSEQQWAKLSEPERMQSLKSWIKLQDGEPISDKLVAPTELLPKSAGGIRNDPGYGTDEKYFLFEFTHKNFEMDPQRLVQDMREVSSLLKENDFHVHLSFELPKKYDQMPAFNSWLKQANDYLYLKGMEDHGMHGTHLLKIPRKPLVDQAEGKPGLLDRVTRGLNGAVDWVSWPASPEFKDNTRYKYRTIGLRSGIYGQAMDPNYTRIGIELRDVTRSMDTWGKTVEQFHASVTNKVWEKKVASSPFEISLGGGAGKAELEEFQQLGLGQRFLWRAIDAEPSLAIPLQRFELAKFRDYRTGGFREASPAQAERIRKARDSYIRELKKVEAEVKDILARKQELTKEDLKGAIRMSMSEWAREAKVAELLGGI